MEQKESIFDRWKDIGIIDCDVHNSIPSVSCLFPYLSTYWCDYITERSIPGFEPNFYPKSVPFSAKSDFVSPAGGSPTSDLDRMREQLLDCYHLRYAVLNCIYGVQLIPNEDLAVALARAINDWQTAEWLDKDSRIKASIIVADQNPAEAVKEIERIGDHPGFIQVLLLARSRMPYGKRYYWPIYEAAEAYGLPVCIHAGGSAGNPITPVGWPSYYIEDYINNAGAFQEQVISLVSEGVFSIFPKLQMVLAEGGFTWLPSLMWRFDKNWKGLRRDVPWVDRLPSEIIRDHFHLTIQPVDAPSNVVQLLEIIDQSRSHDMLLFSTDYPHWHFNSPAEAVPLDFPEELLYKLFVQNPLKVYQKLDDFYK